MTVETVVVAESSDPVEAEIWLDALRSAGIQAAVFERGPGAALGGAVTAGFAHYPVLVARPDFAAARNVIAEVAGGHRLAPLTDLSRTSRAQRNALLAIAAITVGIVVAGLLARVVAG